MKYISLLSIFLFIGCTSAPTPTATAEYDVIPLPQEISLDEDAEPFILHSRTYIAIVDNSIHNRDMERNAYFLRQYIEEQLGYGCDIIYGYNTEKKDSQRSPRIVLCLTGNPEHDTRTDVERGDERAEGYTIDINKERLLIEAETPAGIFYGIQTLRKSLPVEKDAVVALPAGTITDRPRFAYRGAHLDIVRHFFPIDSVKTFIDMMALHNMNHLHWHITDDQGWRIEIKKFPLLTEVGGTRCGTMVAKDFDSCDSIPYGGYITQEEAREVVKYAADRYITVIPEVDMPGHMVAAVTAYPELGCTGGPYEVMTKWGVSDDLLCAGNDKVYEFVEGVLEEILDIFPSKDIHIGGDECPKIRWENCPKCQAKIKALGLKTDKQFTKEQRLQSYFTKYVDAFLSKHGRTCIGWDEILEGGVSDNATVMSWRGEEGGIEAARLSHRVIMVPTSHFYFDYYQTIHRYSEPLAIGSYIPLKKVYNYDPMPAVLSSDEQKFIWGVQANLWTEYIPTFSHALYMYLPRAAALAESQWTETTKKDFECFKQKRLPRLLNIYDLCGFNYSRRAYLDSEEDADATIGW